MITSQDLIKAYDKFRESSEGKIVAERLRQAYLNYIELSTKQGMLLKNKNVKY